MSLNLYQIETEYRSIAQRLMDADGELTPDLEESLAINKEQLQMKSQGYAMVIKETEYEIQIIEGEIKRLLDLQEKRNALVSKLKERITDAMDLYDISEIVTPLIKISFRKSESVEIDNLDLIPNEYKVIPEAKARADKKAIKDAIKNGIDIQGAYIQQNKSLQFK
jgi:hypothetical protein